MEIIKRKLIGGADTPPAVQAPVEPDQKPTEPRSARPKDKTAAVTQPTFQGKTAAQWRDTMEPGNVRYNTEAAKLAETGGIWEFKALFTVGGALVPNAKWIKTSVGKWVWRIGTGEAVTWFNESQALRGAQRRRNDASNGFLVGLVRARARVTSWQGRHGMIYFIDQVESSPVEIIDNGSLGSHYQDRDPGGVR